MASSNLKRIAAAGAISGAATLSALGLGSGVANADDGATTPLQPGGMSSDWQSYLPLLGNISDFVDLGELGVPQDVANYGDIGNLGSLGNLGNLGSLGSLGNIPGLAGG